MHACLPGKDGRCLQDAEVMLALNADELADKMRAGKKIVSNC